MANMITESAIEESVQVLRLCSGQAFGLRE